MAAVPIYSPAFTNTQGKELSEIGKLEGVSGVLGRMVTLNRWELI